MRNPTTGRSWLVLGLVGAALAAGGCGDKAATSSSETDTSASTAQAKVAAPPGLHEAGKLTLGTDFTYPPLESIENGKQTGFDVELATKISGLMGLEPKMVDTRFASLIPGLDTGRFDAIESALYVTAERAKQVDFIPYFTTGQALVVKQDGDFQPQDIKAVCDRTMAVLQGALVEELANGEIKRGCGGKLTVRSFPSDTEAFQEVASGRADVLLTDRAVAAYRVKKIPGAQLHVSSHKVLYPVPVGLAVRKDESKMKRAFEQALAELQRTGELGALLKRYALEPSDPALVKKTLTSAG